MANTKTFNGMEFTAIDYILRNENLPDEWDAECYGVLAHDLSDENRDGDMIYCFAIMPETEADAKAMMANEYGTTYFRIEDGKYIVEG